MTSMRRTMLGWHRPRMMAISAAGSSSAQAGAPPSPLPSLLPSAPGATARLAERPLAAMPPARRDSRGRRAPTCQQL